FHFDTAAKAFLQPMQVSKSGWEKTNPAYEEHYKQNISVTDTAPTKAGWVYPALFQTRTAWVLITEAAIDKNYCATRLQSASPGGEYRIGFPDGKEIKTGGGILPKFTTPYSSPWRILTIGSLKTIIESTLGTDVAAPAKNFDKTFIRPGKASWSWIMSKDDSIVYSEQKRYIDFAAEMDWQYCLIDADWDRKIGYEKIQELSSYAATKNVGLLLWYNSAGDWNTVKYTPKNKLLSHTNRVAEFGRIEAMGIKGVKIDFFGGDGQSVMQYYIDILEDAAMVGLMINFHGATLPRGWHRTYPNLLTTEAVRGFEMITFNQADADLAATHCAMLPFTRNAFDPMDFTPMNLYKIVTKVKRKTTSAFELATSVLFYSGIQHFAESAYGMSQVPDYVRQFLKALPIQWDDVKFIDGYPGKYIVLARRAGNKWYVAGINATEKEKTILLDFKNFQKSMGMLITDGENSLSFSNKMVQTNNKVAVTVKPSGGFVLVLE
ncbi:MAG: glycoside hydrolase family 97 catalytic domain-containing protein, partial [Bacteroidota bacterium]